MTRLAGPDSRKLVTRGRGSTAPAWGPPGLLQGMIATEMVQTGSHGPIPYPGS